MVQYLFCTIVSKMDKDRFNTVGSVSAVVLTKLHNYKKKIDITQRCFAFPIITIMLDYTDQLSNFGCQNFAQVWLKYFGVRQLTKDVFKVIQHRMKETIDGRSTYMQKHLCWFNFKYAFSLSLKQDCSQKTTFLTNALLTRSHVTIPCSISSWNAVKTWARNSLELLKRKSNFRFLYSMICDAFMSKKSTSHTLCLLQPYKASYEDHLAEWTPQQKLGPCV